MDVIRILRYISVIGAAATALIALGTILWFFFSVINSASSQPKTNEDFHHRLALVEESIQANRSQLVMQDLRVGGLRTEVDSQRTSDQRFQDEMRRSIADIAAILVDVRLALAKAAAQGKK